MNSKKVFSCSALIVLVLICASCSPAKEPVTVAALTTVSPSPSLAAETLPPTPLPSPTPSPTPAPTPTPVPTPTPFNEPELAMPENGFVFDFTSGAQKLAPLSVKVPDDSYYYVLLKTADTDQKVMAFIVYPGTTVEKDVPLGTFKLLYAMGSHWYGPEYQFGPNTQHYKTDDLFEFKQEGTDYTGYTVELISQVGGNLSTSDADPEEFK